MISVLEHRRSCEARNLARGQEMWREKGTASYRLLLPSLHLQIRSLPSFSTWGIQLPHCHLKILC